MTSELELLDKIGALQRENKTIKEEYTDVADKDKAIMRDYMKMSADYVILYERNKDLLKKLSKAQKIYAIGGITIVLLLLALATS